MNKYMIAGLKIELNNKYDKFFKNNLENYSYDGNDIDHSINVFFKDVLDEPTGNNYHVFSKSVSGFKSYMYYNENFEKIDLWIDLDAFNDAAVAEYIYTGMIFMFLAQRKGLIAIQGTAINYKEDVILFAAPSGTGKTTHAQMWKDLFGDDVTFLTDLKPLLFIENNEVFVYPSPFSELNSNRLEKNKLKAIVFLDRGVSRDVKKLKNNEALKLIMQNTIKPVNHTVKELKPILEQIINSVDSYQYNVSLIKNAPLIVKNAIYNE